MGEPEHIFKIVKPKRERKPKVIPAEQHSLFGQKALVLKNGVTKSYVMRELNKVCIVMEKNYDNAEYVKLMRINDEKVIVYSNVLKVLNEMLFESRAFGDNAKHFYDIIVSERKRSDDAGFKKYVLNLLKSSGSKANLRFRIIVLKHFLYLVSRYERSGKELEEWKNGDALFQSLSQIETELK